MSRKKILFLSSWYPTDVNPTNGDFVQRHAQAVALLNDVSVLHVIYNSNISSRIQIHTSESNGIFEYIVYFKLPSVLRICKPLYYIYLYYRNIHTISKLRGNPDVIHANILYPIGLIALLTKLIHSIPYVCSEHWSGYLHESQVSISPFRLFCTKLIAKRCNYIIPVSEFLMNSMKSRGILGNYEIVPNVVETSIFNATENHKQKIHTILHVSTLKDSVKNISGILRALAHVAQIRTDFVLEVASENSPEYMLQYAKELQIENHVRFIGYKNRPELAKKLSECSFFILFSNYETFSCVIVESFAAGKPVISSNTVGVKNYITPERGIVVSRQNELELAQAIITMLDTYSNYNAQDLHAFADANFNTLSISHKFNSIYNLIVS